MTNDQDRSARESSIASGWTIEGAEVPSATDGPVEPGAVAADIDDDDGSGAAPQLPAGALVLLGLIGGVYLLYTVVWFSWAQHYSTVNALVAEGSGSLGSVLQQVVFWLAPLAPVLWFVSVLVLNRGARLRTMLLWLVVGALLLVPLPMFGGAIS